MPAIRTEQAEDSDRQMATVAMTGIAMATEITTADRIFAVMASGSALDMDIRAGAGQDTPSC